MRAIEEEIENLRHADCTVLILGETGTGKSVLARRIHALGARARGAFVDVNCAGLSIDFVESELFGHERGSFTGAYAPKNGLLEAAHGGTLFLDEIGDMDLRVQAKVLKVLEEKRFRRMGSVQERSVDVRLIAATHTDLLDAVAARSFRQDLYYRISTVTLTLPPLREREEDLLLIASQMCARLSGGDPVEFAPCAVDKLLAHSWPGNLRELGNVLERAHLRRQGRELRAEDLSFDPVRRPPPRRAVESAPPPPPRVEPPPLLANGASNASRHEIEKEHIRVALAAELGQVKATAERLGMSRSTLYAKLKRHGIDNTRPARGGGLGAQGADSPTSVKQPA
ncbi:MAG: sigma-54-dependent Fis family transcriptional regulator [Labilithrix sp.]|nr:sigma-54-dependent Fis family transcriptional regulator [Labilithrix sp.]MCW5833493.1 sigma-54-dependent Fis family transcriptional regulator [Labilithrix sp.]